MIYVYILPTVYTKINIKYLKYHEYSTQYSANKTVRFGVNNLLEAF